MHSRQAHNNSQLSVNSWQACKCWPNAKGTMHACPSQTLQPPGLQAGSRGSPHLQSILDLGTCSMAALDQAGSPCLKLHRRHPLQAASGALIQWACAALLMCCCQSSLPCCIEGISGQQQVGSHAAGPRQMLQLRSVFSNQLSQPSGTSNSMR